MKKATVTVLAQNQQKQPEMKYFSLLDLIIIFNFSIIR